MLLRRLLVLAGILLTGVAAVYGTTRTVGKPTPEPVPVIDVAPRSTVEAERPEPRSRDDDEDRDRPRARASPGGGAPSRPPARRPPRWRRAPAATTPRTPTTTTEVAQNPRRGRGRGIFVDGRPYKTTAGAVGSPLSAEGARLAKVTATMTACVSRWRSGSTGPTGRSRSTAGASSPTGRPTSTTRR